jgi:biopolymer transport protein ExbD
MFPMDTLGARLRRRREELSYNDEVVVASMDNVSFKYVVAVMDLCRAAGLGNIGLSSATDNPDKAP